MLWGILLLVDLAAVGEALIWCKLGDIHQRWKMKTAHYLFNVCVDKRCLDQVKREKKAQTLKSLVSQH